MENVSDNASNDSSFKCLDEIDDIINQMFWMPSIAEGACDINQDPFKQYRAIFNKITTVDDTFLKLVNEFGELIDAESEDLIKEVARMYFEKVTSETVFLKAHVQFTTNLLNRAPFPKKCQQQLLNHRHVFKKEFIRECQQRFERNVLNANLNNQLQLSPQKISEIESAIERDEQETVYEKDLQITQKSINTVRFIGELYNNEILTPTIMIGCMNALLDRNSQLHLECLCNLLTVVGARLENQIKHHKFDPKYKINYNNCFKRLLDIAHNEDENVKICNRLRCHILDVIDLRENNWSSRRETQGASNFDKSNRNQRSRRDRHFNSKKNGIKDRGHKQPARSLKEQSNDSANTELILERIKDLLKNEVDVNVIHKFITDNLAGSIDAENMRSILRTVVECLMEENTLKLRGNEEVASILRMLFELLEKIEVGRRA